MISKAFAPGRLAVLAFALILGTSFLDAPSLAQQAAPAAPASSSPAASPPAATTPAPPSSAPTAPAASTPTAPAAATPTPAAPSAAAPAASPPAASTPAPASPPSTLPPAASPPADAEKPADDSSGQSLEMTARPAAYIEGKANWNEGFNALMGSFATIKAELAKAGIAPTGHPLAVFTETDDNGFSYRTMIPIAAAAEGKTSLSDLVKLGQTPAGKAMKFPHRGSYADIDSTYEAITAYLDEKGLEAANLFVEEYLNDVKTPDDPNLQVDIYVLLK
jgi:effector-binding domain-containing protein